MNRRTMHRAAAWRRWGVVLLLAAALTVMAGTSAGAQEDGQAVFNSNCSGCHQSGGVGIPGVFPPLAGNPHVQDTEYVKSTIRNGRQGEIVVDGVTYTGQMPAFPNLTDAQIDAVVVYIQGLGGGGTATTTTAPGPATTIPGDIVALREAAGRGEALFTGARTLANGGPACLACHTAGSLGNMGGEGLGPDLTSAYQRLGDDGLRSAVTDLHPGLMAGLYAADPLTPDEAVDLAAFLQLESSEDQGGFLDGLLIIGIGGLIVLLAYLALVRSDRPKRRETPS